MFERERNRNLLAILLSHAPHGEAQNLCLAVYQRMRNDGLSPHDIEKQLVSALSDGLNYGNWPWAIKDLTTNTYLSATVENLAAEIDDPNHYDFPTRPYPTH